MREAQRRYRVLPPWLFAADELRKRIDVELTAIRYWEGARWRLGRWGAAAAAVVALFVLGGGGVGAALVLSGGDPVVVAVKTVSRAASTTAPTTTVAPSRPTTRRVPRPAPARPVISATRVRDDV